MKLILILLVLVQFAFGATTSHRTDKLKLGKSVGEDIYIYADNGNSNLPFLFFDFSAGLWKQSNDGVSSEVIGGSSVITTEGDLIIGNASNVDSRLPIGTVGQLLTADGTTAAWQDAPISTTLDTKGQIQTYTTVNANLDVGSDGEFLVADSAEATGLKWSNQLQGKINPVTDWQTYPCAYVNFTIGNGTESCSFREVGDSIDISIDISMGTTSSITGSMSVILPNSKVIDGAKWLGSQSGNAIELLDSSTPGNRQIGIGRASGSAILLLTSGLAAVSSTAPFTWSTSDVISFNFYSIPIIGQSSGLDAVVENKTVAQSRFDITVAQAIPNNTETSAVFDRVNYDNTGNVNTVANSYTIPEDGVYTIHSTANLYNITNSIAAANTRGFLTFKRDGGNETTLGNNRIGAATTSSLWSFEVGQLGYTGEFTAGEVLTFFVEHNFGTNVYMNAFSIAVDQQPENFVIGGTFGKCQRKYLSASITTDTLNISDLRFNNLDIGSRYKTCIQGRSVTVNTDTHFFSVKTSGTSVAFLANTGPSGESPSGYSCGSFISTNATLTTDVVGINASNSVFGNSASDGTWIELCTSNNSITTEWN